MARWSPQNRSEFRVTEPLLESRLVVPQQNMNTVFTLYKYHQTYLGIAEGLLMQSEGEGVRMTARKKRRRNEHLNSVKATSGGAGAKALRKELLTLYVYSVASLMCFTRLAATSLLSCKAWRRP